MREPNLLEKLQLFIFYKLPQYFCKHERIIFGTAHKDMYKGYGDYYGWCEMCDKSFRIIVDSEITK